MPLLSIMLVGFKESDFLYTQMPEFDSDAACVTTPDRSKSFCSRTPDLACLRQALCKNRSLYLQLSGVGAGQQRLDDIQQEKIVENVQTASYLVSTVLMAMYLIT